LDDLDKLRANLVAAAHAHGPLDSQAQIAAARVGVSFVHEHHPVAPHVDFVFAAIFCALPSASFAGIRPAATFPECAFKIWNTH